MILAYSVYNFLNLDMDLLFLSNLIGQGIKTSQFLKCGPQITSSAFIEMQTFVSKPTKSETPGLRPSYLGTNVSEQLFFKKVMATFCHLKPTNKLFI